MATVKSRFDVEVTEQDIERARRNDSYTCVVAQAIARTIPDATRIDVDIQSIRFSLPEERRIYMTPYAVQGYIVAFDAGDPIEPFTFQIRDPKKAARQKTTSVGKEIHKADSKLRRVKEKLQASPIEDPQVKELLGEERKEIEKELKAATKDLEGVKAAYEGAQRRKTEPGVRVPRVHKKRTRTYGHRDLRINKTYYQDEEDLIQAKFPEKT